MHDVIVHQTRRADWVRELEPANYPVTRARFMGSVVTHTGPSYSLYQWWPPIFHNSTPCNPRRDYSWIRTRITDAQRQNETDDLLRIKSLASTRAETGEIVSCVNLLTRLYEIRFL